MSQPGFYSDYRQVRKMLCVQSSQLYNVCRFSDAHYASISNRWKTMFNMEPRDYKLCAKVTVTKALYQMAPRARATHQTLLNAKDQRNTGTNVDILDENIIFLVTLKALKSLFAF